MQTSKEGVMLIKTSKGTPHALVYKDPATRQNVFYSLSEMSMDDLQMLINKTDNFIKADDKDTKKDK